jgi:hypothetical protein
MTMTILSFLVAAVTALLTALVMCIPMELLVLDHVACFCDLHIDVLILSLLSGECLIDLSDLLRLERVGEDDLEDHKQVTRFECLLMVGHTVTLHGLDLVGLDHLAGLILDADLLTVKVGQHEVNTRESLEEGDLLFNEQVSSLTLEGLMALLLNLDHHVTCFRVGELICLTVEHVLLTVGGTFVNLYFKNFLLFGDFLAIASLALVLLIDDLTFSLALIAWASTLRVHAGAELLHDSPHTSSLASCACHHSSALATETITLGAYTITVHSDLGSLTIVEVS